MNTIEWVHEPEAAKRLAIKQNTLRTMRRERRLEPGEHWVYATGAVGGPVLYDLTAITEMQCPKPLEAVQAEDEHRAAELKLRKQAVKTFSDDSLDQLIAEVQS